MKALNDAHLVIRDRIYDTLCRWQGETITEVVAREGANILAAEVVEALVSGLKRRLEVAEAEADAKARSVPGQDIIVGAGKTAETLEMRMAEMERHAEEIIK